jgi:predicted nucleic acid-binding protein
MKEWLVDTNVLLDVLGADPHFGERSKAALVACATTGVLVINPVIFAEVGVMIDSLEELNVLLPETLFRRDPLPWEAAFLAGRAFRRYKQAGGGKRRMLADFLIGAHAAVAGFTLLSRDRSYLHYFDIEVLDPSGAE